MESQKGQDTPQKDTSPAAPVDASPESARAAESPQSAEAPFDDPESLDEDDRVVEGDEEPPARSDEDPGDDPAVPNEAAPETPSIESIEADPNDTRGQGV